MVNMTDDDAEEEPGESHPADDQGDESSGERDDADLAQHPGFRSAAFDSIQALAEGQRQIMENVLKGAGGLNGMQQLFSNILPQAEAVNAQRQIMENVLKGAGGLNGMQQLFSNILPQAEAVNAQRQIMENVLKGAGGLNGMQQLFSNILPQAEAFRQFTGLVIPQLIKLPPLKLPTDWFPRNWEDVPDLDFDTAIGIVQDEGIPLVWVPRPAIVAELVGAADADARDGILLSFRDDLADDCLTALGEVTAPELKPLAELAGDAVSSLRSGHDSSAQALAGNVFDTLLRDATRRGVIFAGPPVGYFKYDKVLKRITPVSEDTVIRRFRPDCVLSAALSALQSYDPSDPPPNRFVRHATAHCARPEQYTPVNAIVAVMLVSSMLREAQASGW